MQPLSNQQLAIKANEARILGLTMVHDAASGHPGGSMSCLDLVTALYFNVMHVDTQNPPDRDRFVMSKGHCSPALYPVLALRGFFPVDDLHMFRRIDGHMSGHVEMHHVRGVDMSTGSLGQGVSAAVGMALGGKLNHKDYRVYAVMGDGELDEGQGWEAFMSAAKYKLDNLCVIVDVNGLQIDGATKDVMPLEPLDQKFAAFGFHVITINGHDFDQILSAYQEAAATKGQPTVILAKTVKGKGISFMENDAGWHGKAPNDQQLEQAVSELKAESNMQGVAAGLSTCGFKPFTNTFAMFAAGRSWEQVRNSIAYPGMNVKVVGSHGGLSVGEDGATHQCIEDFSLMRTIPGMTVLCPCDANEMTLAVEALLQYEGPAYMRLGRSAVETVTDSIPGYHFQLGKGVTLRDGKDVTIVAVGMMVQMALKAADILSAEGISARVLDFHTIKPLDQELLLAAAKETGAIVTTEEHNIIGGLGSAVAEFLAENCPVPMVRHGVNDQFGRSGKADQVLAAYGLTPEVLADKARLAISRKG